MRIAAILIALSVAIPAKAQQDRLLSEEPLFTYGDPIWPRNFSDEILIWLRNTGTDRQMANLITHERRDGMDQHQP